MAKKRRKADINKNQLSLFDILKQCQSDKSPQHAISSGSLNMQRILRNALYSAIKQSSLSRWEIAAKMSELIDQDISKYMLDAWTSESKEGHRFPAEYLPAFCLVTGCMEPFHVLSNAAGVFTMPGPDALRAEIQRLDEEVRRANAEKRKRVVFLKEMEGR